MVLLPAVRTTVMRHTIRSRHAEYEKKTAAVAEYYKQYGKVVYVNGEGDVDEIFQSLCHEIELRDRA